jgi:hypothetical protein
VRDLANRIAEVLRIPSHDRVTRTMADLRHELQAMRWRLVQGTQALRAAGPLDIAAQQSIMDANSWLGRFGAIEFCVAEQFEGKSWPLYGALPPADALESRQVEIADRFVDTLNGLVQEDRPSDSTETAGTHRDTRSSTNEFLRHAQAAYRILLAQAREEPSTFLDVGCGAGQKVLLAGSFFERADGVELDSHSAAAALELHRRLQTESRVFKEDAFDFNGYGEYRVVCLFKPIMDPVELGRLEERIVAGVRPGTILIAPHSGFAERAESHGAACVDGAVFLAGASADEAGALREEASRIGTFVAHSRPPIMVDAVWQQLVMASWMRGYNPFP